MMTAYCLLGQCKVDGTSTPYCVLHREGALQNTVFVYLQGRPSSVPWLSNTLRNEDRQKNGCPKIVCSSSTFRLFAATAY